MMDKADVCVQVFLRFPRVGETKTRLAADIGEQRTYEFYRRCSLLTIAECLRLTERGVKVVLSFASELDIQEATTWVENEFGASVLQSGKLFLRWQLPSPDLGERMIDAIDEELNLGVQKAVIVGSDIPDVTAEVVQEALHLLDDHDFVLGPAFDGGYYLVGATKLHQHLFRGVHWSTEQVYQRTEENAKAFGLKVSERTQLPTLRDIDTLADLKIWYRDSEPGAERSRRFKILRDYVGETLSSLTAGTASLP